MIGLVLFRSATVPDALRVLGRGVSGLGLQLFRSGVLSGLGLDWIELMILALSILFSAWVTIHNQKEDMRVTLEKKPIWLRWIALYALLAGRAFHLGLRCVEMRRHFPGYCAFGIALWISLQSFVSMGVNLGLLPTKGLTLPLMSYGGSAILMNLVAIAVVLRIDYENKVLMRGGRV